WPTDLAALPPDCGQSLLAAGGGTATVTSVRAGSTSMAASLVRTGIRLPTVGVAGFLPRWITPHPPSRLSATNAIITRFIDLLPSLRPHHPQGPAPLGPLPMRALFRW